MAKAYLQHGRIFMSAEHMSQEVAVRVAFPHISRIQPKASSHAGSLFILQQWAGSGGARSARFASIESIPQGQVVPRLSHGEQ